MIDEFWKELCIIFYGDIAESNFYMITPARGDDLRRICEGKARTFLCEDLDGNWPSFYSSSHIVAYSLNEHGEVDSVIDGYRLNETSNQWEWQ